MIPIKFIRNTEEHFCFFQINYVNMLIKYIDRNKLITIPYLYLQCISTFYSKTIKYLKPLKRFELFFFFFYYNSLTNLNLYIMIK